MAKYDFAVYFAHLAMKVIFSLKEQVREANLSHVDKDLVSLKYKNKNKNKKINWTRN